MTETQVAEVRKDHSALLQAFIDLGNEVLGLREEYRKALEQVDAVRITLAAVQRERDEARAERENWREACRKAEAEGRSAGDTLEAALKQERAEVQRLKAAKDGAYSERNQCVALLARMALALGLPAGLTQHPLDDANWEPDWRTIVWIQLPTGQVTWHFHDSERHLLDGIMFSPNSWDGHDTPEKYRRVNAAFKAEAKP